MWDWVEDDPWDGGDSTDCRDRGWDDWDNDEEEEEYYMSDCDFWPESDDAREAAIAEYEDAQNGFDAYGNPFVPDDWDWDEEEDEDY
jgi:hypothetical protein